MATYTASTSDKSKKKAIKKLLCGGIGLHLFYVGKITAGIIRLIIGLIGWIVVLSGIFGGGGDGLPVILIGLAIIVLFNIFDLINLALGKFQDNVGAYLRE